MTRFTDKVAIVTGAAEGMGAAVAARIVADGGSVCLVDRNAEMLAQTVERLQSPRAFGAVADISSKSAVDDCVAQTVARFGAVHLLHNNAAITGKPGPVLGLDETDVNAIFSVNFMGPLFAIQAVVPHMRAAGGGSIVNMASLFGIRPAVGMGVYGASKGAIISLTKTLSIELAADRIRLNVVAPGAVDTTLLRTSNSTIHDPSGPSFEEKLAALPFGRAATPVEAANLITWLLSEEASYVSGAIHHLDGAVGA